MSSGLPPRIQRFEVRELLGSGGMGSVYRAHDAELLRDVAIKVLQRPTALAGRLSTEDTLDLRNDGPATPDDLLREARVMAQLSHPNVLPVYEVGLVDQSVFMVMEHIAGSDLATWLQASRPTRQILAMFAQAGRGLLAAHERGIVHRDFKPSNVLVGADERARVADFGLSAMAVPTSSAMVRVDDGRGTPRYMAPELHERSHATPASDVYAFSVALDEALEGRNDVPPRVRALIGAGRSPHPKDRPSLRRIIDALETNRSRRPWWIAAGAIVAIVAGSSAAFLLAGGDSTECDDVPTALDPARQTRLARLRASSPRIVELIGEHDRATRRAFVRTCVAERDKQLTAEQAKMRRSCLMRRVFELGPAADLTIASPARATARLDRVAPPDACEDITAAPLPADTREVAAVWARYAETWDLANGGPENVPTFLPAIRAVRDDAVRLNEQELELRALSGLQAALMTVDKLQEADDIQQEIYRKALALNASTYAANALLARARIASQRRDPKLQAELVALVQDLADKPTSPPTLRAKVYRGLGTAARDRGDYKLAAKHFQAALDQLARVRNPPETFELEMINQLALALSKDDDTRRLSIDVARKGVARARELHAQPVNHAFAYNMLAVTLSANGDREGALAARKQAFDAFSAALPADNASVIFGRMDYAHDLIEVGRPAEAREHLLVALAASENNETVKGERSHILVDLGQATFDMGRFREGLDLIREGVEASMSQFGVGHTRTTRALGMQVIMELELGLLDDAERTAATLARGIAQWTTNKQQAQAAHAGWLTAEIEKRRGRPKRAEALAKRGLATLLELKVPADRIALVRTTLADSLFAQGRVAEARAQLDAAFALKAVANDREDDIAEREVLLAKIEVAEGNRAAATVRAKHALAVFERYPRHIIARREAEQLIRDAK